MPELYNFIKNDLTQLKEAIRSIEEQIQLLISEKSLQKRWLRTEELAEYLSLSQSQIHNLKVNGTITCKKLGGTNYYDKDQIDNYFKTQEI